MSRCFDIMTLNPTATPTEVRSRWRELAGSGLHPDHGGDMEAWLNIKAAYDACLKLALQPRTCFDCRGIGRVSLVRQFGSKPCEPCQGTGRVSLA